MSQAQSVLLALNIGSTGLKAASFSFPEATLGRRDAPSEIERIAIETEHHDAGALDEVAEQLLAGAVARLSSLRTAPIVVAHRIVHGGDHAGPAELTPEVLEELRGLSALAPLHQPPALALARAASQRWPRARQVAVFDTSWHQAMPEIHRVLPVPYSLYLRGVKRYGFHGLAFQSAMRQLAALAPDLARGRVVLAHLGGGSSLSAVRDGRCVNTTMGMTPLDGIPMSTRPGALDPGVLLHLQRALGMPARDIDQLLWHECGMKGLSGESGDMRQLLGSGSDGAHRAIAVYVSAVAQGVAAMAASVGGIDCLVFSGGVGAHAAEIRARVAGELDWLGVGIDPRANAVNAREISAADVRARTFALAVDEELEIALAAAALAR